MIFFTPSLNLLIKHEAQFMNSEDKLMSPGSSSCSSSSTTSIKALLIACIQLLELIVKQTNEIIWEKKLVHCG